MLYLLIFWVSVLVGFINTLAGSGSLVMLPILMNMGLSATIANGTNRIAVFFQSFVGVVTFLRAKKLNWRPVILPLLLPSILGGIFGAYTASIISPVYLKNFITILMFVMLLVMIFNPEKWLKTPTNSIIDLHSINTWLLMFLAGFYGGFIQASVGVVLLAVLVLQVKYDLNVANGLKVLIVGSYAFPVLCVFVWQGQVDWFWGFLTAAGQSIGAYLGAKFASHSSYAKLWTYWLLIIVIVVSIIQFMFL
jgi:uncharacterized membrane protein YfcA